MRNSSRSTLVACVIAVAAGGCLGRDDAVTSPHLDGPAAFARGGPGVTVTGTNPSFGYQGDVAKKVIINGSGFTTGAIAAWERNGVPDPKIQVLSTVVRSSSQIEATINISPDADLSLYDVSVMTSKGKGVGTESFEVTTAEFLGAGTLGGLSSAQAVNDNGDATGYTWVSITKSKSEQHAFYYDAATNSMQDLGPGPGSCRAQGTGISQSSLVIVGLTIPAAHDNCRWGLAWTRASTTSPWGAAMRLPHGAGTSSAADAVTHIASMNATVAVGMVNYASVNRPTYWLLADGASSWSAPQEMPTSGSSGRIRAVSASGTFGGNTTLADGREHAIVWEASGSATILQPAAGTTPDCFAHGLSPNGQYAVGECGGFAVFWGRDAGGAWNVLGQKFEPTALRAWSVNDAGQAVGIGGMVWEVGTPGAIQLDGLGDGGAASVARAISNTSPAVMVGMASQKGGNTRFAVRWLQYWSLVQ